MLQLLMVFNTAAGIATELVPIAELLAEQPD